MRTELSRGLVLSTLVALVAIAGGNNAVQAQPAPEPERWSPPPSASMLFPHAGRQVARPGGIDTAGFALWAGITEDESGPIGTAIEVTPAWFLTDRRSSWVTRTSVSIAITSLPTADRAAAVAAIRVPVLERRLSDDRGIPSWNSMTADIGVAVSGTSPRRRFGDLERPQYHLWLSGALPLARHTRIVGQGSAAFGDRSDLSIGALLAAGVHGIFVFGESSLVSEAGDLLVASQAGVEFRLRTQTWITATLGKDFMRDQHGMGLVGTLAGRMYW